MNYKSTGVDVELGDDVSKILYNAARLTWEHRKWRFGEVVELFEDFTGLRGIHVGGLPVGTFTNLGFDGIGIFRKFTWCLQTISWKGSLFLIE